MRQKQTLEIEIEETEIEIATVQTRRTDLSQTSHCWLSHQTIRNPEVPMRKRGTRQLQLALLNNVLGIAGSRPSPRCFPHLPC